MDDTLMRVVLLLIDIIGPISIGYFLKQKNLVKPAFNDFMIKLNVRVSSRSSPLSLSGS